MVGIRACFPLGSCAVQTEIAVFPLPSPIRIDPYFAMPGHFPAAYAAIQDTLEYILPYGAPFCTVTMAACPLLYPVAYLLCLLIKFRTNQGFMGIFFPDPFFFRFLDAVLRFPRCKGSSALYQPAEISLAFQDTFHCALIPAFIYHFGRATDLFGFLINGRRVDSSLIQAICHSLVAFRLHKFPVNILDNLYSIPVRFQFPDPSLPICLIPIRRRTPHIGASRPTLFQGQLALDRRIFGIHIVYQVLDFRYHLLCAIALFPCIIPIRNRYEADPQKREYFLNIISGFQIISAKPG